MQSIFDIEIEAAYRRSQWERAVSAKELHAKARPRHGSPRWSQLASATLASLRSLATIRLPFPAWNPAAVKCAKTLKGGRAPAT